MNSDSNKKKIGRWKDISSDPNSSQVLVNRIELLAKARRKELISNRAAYICGLAKGKEVLDIGVVDHCSGSSNREDWLHGKICSYAKTCLGIDILEEEIRVLRDKGYNVIVWDISCEPLSQIFDLIVIGDVIEHLGNPLGFFSNVKKMLNSGGRIVLTTPNPWYANVIIKNLFKGKPFTDSADHVAWFDAGTFCELAARSGLVLERYAGVMANRSSVRSALFFRLAPILIRLGLRSEVFAKTMIYEFVLARE
jgi:2-polyprenyl-3-methyl-5-hydroxy-6-metoxy-1,4-benzoquinol methylase